MRSAGKQMTAIPRRERIMLAGAIDNLAVVPRPPNCRKLRGAELWRIRLERYRVIYSIDDESKIVRIVKVGVRREDTYRSL